MPEQEPKEIETDLITLSEEELNRKLYIADRDATIFIRNRTRGHVTSEQITQGEKSISDRNKAFLEVIRRNEAGTLTSIQVIPHIEVVLPIITGDRRDFKGKVDLNPTELRDHSFSINIEPKE